MSTTMYLQCLCHNPPLNSGEVGQHAYDLTDIRVYIANRKILEKMVKLDIPASWDNHWVGNAASFLEQHPSCHIGIINEYGGTYLIGVGDPEDETKPVKL